MGGVVEEHEARVDRVLEIDDAQARGGLIQPVPIPSRIEAEQAAEDEPQVQPGQLTELMKKSGTRVMESRRALNL